MLGSLKMGITINYKNINYGKCHIITKLTNIILGNIDILKVISNLYIIEGNLKKKKNNDIVLKKKLWETSMKNSVIAGLITKDEADEFFILWNTISSENLGRVLEQIIAHLGPYNYEELVDFDKSMDVTVDETNIENSFDVVFFNKNFCEVIEKNKKIKITGYSEFHECKKNVCTYIPSDYNRELKDEVKRKLDFIKNTYSLMGSGDFYIPTLYPVVNSQREFLESYNDGEYSFIEILDIGQLHSKYS